MELRRLEMFVRIIDTGSVTAAAKALHLTQPALTRNMKQLEADLETPLFQRSGRGLVLTAAGRALEPRARALLDSASAARRDVRRSAQHAYFDLRLGTVDSVATYVLPQALGTLRQTFPDLGIKLYTARTADLLQRLAAGLLDLVIIAWQGPPRTGRATRLGPYYPRYYGRTDRFPTLAQATTHADLQAFPLVQIEPMPGQPTMIPDHALTFALTSSVAAVKSLVMAGFGIGALPTFMLTAVDADRLVAANVAHDPDCGLFLVASATWSSARERDIEAQLAALLRDRLGD
jgi:DNA-binding transcriptional LysR family regulator